jgi:U3 small nucleolar RNA-associated protein 14
MNKATVGKDSRDANRSAAKVDRHRSKQTDAREAEKDDAQVEIDPQVVLARSKAPAAPQIVAPAQRKGTAMSTMDPAGDASSDEDDEEQHNAQRGKGPAAFKQRELVARAFAGDNVVAVSRAPSTEEDCGTDVRSRL